MSARRAVDVQKRVPPPADLQKLRGLLTEKTALSRRTTENLKMAHYSKYGQALEAPNDITPENKAKRIMVPLTSSSRAGSTIQHNQRVEVGTGIMSRNRSLTRGTRLLGLSVERTH
jgi:hypothetical protein